MQEAGTGVQPGQDARLLDVAVQNPEGVVQGGVESIFRGLAGPALEPVGLRHQPAEAVEIHPPGRALQAQDRAAALVEGARDVGELRQAAGDAVDGGAE